MTAVEELGRGGWRAEGGVNPKQLLRLEGRGEGGKVINKFVGRRTGSGGAIPDSLLLSVK